jgi:S-formylglutathione hydrolase FrmB
MQTATISQRRRILIVKLNRVATAALFILLCTLFSSGTLSQQGTAPTTTSKLLQLKIQAPSLKGNLLGDPAEQPIYVCLPPGYESSTQRYPTLYLLHGFTANSSVWINGAYQGMKLQTLMDDSIKSGKVREMIVVAANGSNAYKGSFYTNSSVTGNWEDFIVRDLVNYVDANYRTIPRAESRGIAGHSMGGYGSVMLGMKHPEIFSAVYALSPCCLAMEADMGEANSAWSGVLQLTSKEQLSGPSRSFAQFFHTAFVAKRRRAARCSSNGPIWKRFTGTTRKSEVSAQSAMLNGKRLVDLLQSVSISRPESLLAT